jgi:hypothetical protein
MSSVPLEVKTFINELNVLLRKHKMIIDFTTGSLIFKQYNQGNLEDNYTRVTLADDFSELYESKLIHSQEDS